MLGGQRNVPMLGGQRNVPMLGGQWNVPNLVASGRRKRRFFFSSSHFPLQATLLRPSFFFPLI
jgi:hypothetical protein